MSRSRPRGLVFFALIGLIGVAALVVLVKLLLPRGSGGSAEEAAERGQGAPARVLGTGTTWMDEEASAEAAGVVEGVVLDAEGRPLDGARVTLSRARGRNEEGGAPYSFMQPRGTAVTAGGGRFRMDKLLPGVYRAVAMMEGWAPANRALALAEKQTERVELKLGHGGLALEGRVLDIGGGGVGGARVTAFGRGMTSGQAPLLYQTTSDGEGRYRMTLGKGHYSLRAEAEGYAGVSDDALVTRPTTKDLRLVPAARIAGQVVERGSGQPVAQAEVTLTSALRTDFKPPHDTRTDDSGRFEFTALEPGRYEVMGRKGALIGAGEVVGVAVAQAVDGVEVKVDRGYTITGRVKDEQGKGVGNTRISASRDTPPWGQTARTRTNPDGSYALEGMLPGSYRLAAGDQGYGPGRGTAKVLASNLSGVDILLPAASKVVGKVLTATGQPVEGARISGTFEANTGGGSSMSTGESTTSAADGSFELTRALVGNMRLSARHDDLGSAHLGPEPLQAGETRRVELRLKPGASISGVVRTEDGKPAAGVNVAAMARELRMFMDARDVSGPDGRYKLTGLPPARITVGAERTGRTTWGWGMEEQPNQKTLPLAEGEQRTGVDLVVAPAGLAIKGMTVASDGKPVPGAVIHAAPERDGRAFRGMARDLKAYSDLDGNFSLTDLPRGTYTLWAAHPEHPEAEVKGTSPGSGVVRVAFPASASVAGVVVLPDGKPVHHYSITVMPGPGPNEKPDDRRRRQMNSFDLPVQRVQDPQGAFELKRMAGGSHELQVSTADGATASQVVTVQAGEKKAGIRIQVTPGLRITGRVLELGSNKPMAGVGVAAMGPGTARAHTDSIADGSFVVEGAPAGDMVRLSVAGDRDRYIPEFKEVEIKSGQTSVDAGTNKQKQGNSRERYEIPPSERGTTAVMYKHEGERVVLRQPPPESPAGKAGLKAGDLLLAIDGKSTGEIGNGAMSYLLMGRTGTTVQVTVSSGGEAPRTLTLTRESQPPPRPPGSPASTARN